MLLEALFVASTCQAQFVLICGTGVLAARQGMLNGATLGQVTRFYLRFLMPCIVLQLNQVFTLERTLRWCPIVFVAVLHIAAGAVLGRLCAALFRLRSPLTECLTLVTAFGNCGSLPFVLVLPVVTGWSRSAADPDAFGKGMAIIGLYLTAWFVVFFTAGTAYLGTIAPLSPEAPPASDHPTDSTRCESYVCEQQSDSSTIDLRSRPSDAEASGSRLPLRLHDANAEPQQPPSHVRRCCAAVRGLDPMIMYILLSVVLGAIAPVRAALSDKGVLSWVGLTIASLGHAGVVIGTIILGGSLWQAYDSQRKHGLPCERDAQEHRGRERLREPHAISTTAEQGGAQHGDSGEDGVGAEACQVSPGRGGGGEKACNASASTICGESSGLAEEARPLLLVGSTVTIRLLLLPLLAMPLNVVLARLGVVPRDEPLLMLVLHIMTGVPSSQTLVAVLIARGRTDLAASISKVYVPQYLISILSITLLIVVAVMQIGPGV